MLLLSLSFVISRSIVLVLATPVLEDSLLPDTTLFSSFSPFAANADVDTISTQPVIENVSSNFDPTGPWASFSNPSQSETLANSPSLCRSQTNGKLRVRDTANPVPKPWCKLDDAQGGALGVEVKPDTEKSPPKNEEGGRREQWDRPETDIEKQWRQENYFKHPNSVEKCKFSPFEIHLYCLGPVGTTRMDSISIGEGISVPALFYERIEGCHRSTHIHISCLLYFFKKILVRAYHWKYILQRVEHGEGLILPGTCAAPTST